MVVIENKGEEDFSKESLQRKTFKKYIDDGDVVVISMRKSKRKSTEEK